MDRTAFWKLIDQSRAASGGDVERQEQALQQLLVQLPLEEIGSFEEHFRTAYNQVHRPDLWATFWLTFPYPRDTDRHSFSAWVVGQGKHVHTTLCEYPERLFDVLRDVYPDDPDPFPFSEELGYAATAAYKSRTSTEPVPIGAISPPQLWDRDFDDEEAILLMPELSQRIRGEQARGLDLTLADWEASVDLVPLLAFINRRGRTSNCRSSFARKMRWFACACCRRIWHLLSEASNQEAVRMTEGFAAGQESTTELYRTYEVQLQALRSPSEIRTGRVKEVALTALYTASPHYSDAIRAAVHSVRALTEGNLHPEAIRQQETTFQINALRDLFGDLFYSRHMQPQWVLANGGAVRRLAEAIDQERAFERLPVLADALEEAGCAESMILGHCRGGGTHVRGCWVIDMLLHLPGMVPEVSAWPYPDTDSPSS
jgi:hypothetical protein